MIKWFDGSQPLWRLSRALVVVLFFAGATPLLHAQALPTASAPEPRWLVGGTYSFFAADYGKRDLGGGSGFVDYSRSERISYEAEVRFLTINEEVGTHQSTYLVGGKFPYHRRWLTAYGKVLIGDGHFHFPYDYADGNYFVLAPGGGVDLALGRSRYSVRLVDFEYQWWLNFPFGTLRPYGASTGIAVHFH
ncbi:hypothetical protein RBB77_21155 [Tunturibacter psychrotolerans]|uniref:Outer membrane protein beta-barrel domain-containing protein n=1 Tax=Tunturiibacter psychrotolerans TaxID=3069686 RepID=A0AAU7ZPL9_9BACT